MLCHWDGFPQGTRTSVVGITLLLSLKKKQCSSNINTKKVKVLVAQSCPTLCNPMDCSPSGSSIHGILQARLLEWVAIPFSSNLANPGIEPGSPALKMDSLLFEPPRKPILYKYLHSYMYLSLFLEFLLFSINLSHGTDSTVF